MKNIAYVLSAVVLMTGCSSEKTQDEPIQETTKEVEEKISITNPEQVIQAFKDKGLPIGKVFIHNAENDPNKLLGRPDGYTASAKFEDTSVEQDQPIENDEIILPKGGIIEIWNTQEAAEARKDYIDEVTDLMNMPALKQYMYIHKGVLLRLEYDIVPDQAKKYEDVLNSL